MAASKGMLRLLSWFPPFSLAININNHNKLLQTPLHLAIYHGHIEFAIKLLDLGADPSLQDGYGRHAIDWALGHESLIQAIHKKCPELTLTPHEAQKLSVQRSLLYLSDLLPRLRPNDPWPILQHLARYFLFLNDSNNARHLFQIRLSQDIIPVTDIFYGAICSICGKPIASVSRTRFVFKVCAHMDICHSCIEKYPFHSRLNPNKKHAAFKVSVRSDDKFQLTGPVSQRLTYFLSNLIDGPLEEVTYRSETQPSSHDSLSSSARKKKALISNSTISLLIIFSAVLLGVLATFLEFWYF